VTRRLAPVLAAGLAAAALAGCGSDDNQASSAQATPSATATATTTATATPASGGGLKDLSKKPEIPKPSGKPPSKLEVRDIVRGTGRRAKAGDTVTVQYVGVNYADGKQFDASWDHGQPFSFQLGAGMVIPGWDKGVAGMRVGGRRELIIPPDLGYGPQGQPPVIEPNETLVFVVDLKRIG
jgi:peptidylprolyl isomerase